MAEPTAPAPASSNRGVMIVLSYLWILALVPLLTEKTDKDVQWHAKHGIVLMVVEIAFWILYTIFISIIPLGCVMGLISPLFALGFLVVHIMAIVKGLNGQRLIIPYVSEYANKF
jgi:uncharacterized membrane protein